MQGRLSPPVAGKIQAFPWESWREELTIAQQCGITLMEWTLDQDRLYENPLMAEEGREEIKLLMRKTGVRINSLTGDCFMQAPFYKARGVSHQHLLEDLENIIKASAALGIRIVLIPLVDEGRLENAQQAEQLKRGLETAIPLLAKTGVMISFESDFPPEQLGKFIQTYDAKYFGITYDIGNSAALGYAPEEEMKCYGRRIVNVHVKDRMLGGKTVPLGTGTADIPQALKLLSDYGYDGNYILQTARAADGDHIGILCKYYDMMIQWLEKDR